MKLIGIILISVLLSSAFAEFVYDKRIPKNFSSKKIGRDFSGSIAYGSFQYNGASCPTGAPGDTSLTGIFINYAATSGCFTDLSIVAGAVSEVVGFICVPGAGGFAPHTIHFGIPSINGFIIGGSNFVVGSGASVSSSYTWGSIGAPSYTGPTTDGSCTGTTCSTGSFCDGPCTPQPTCTPSSGFACTSIGTTTSYFINTATVTAPSNCGGGFGAGGCCSPGGNFPATVGNGQNLLTNPGFETGDLTGWTLISDPFNSFSVFSYLIPPVGTFFTESDSGQICQTVFTSPNSVYDVSLYVNPCECASSFDCENHIKADGVDIFLIPLVTDMGCPGFLKYSGFYTTGSQTSVNLCIGITNINSYTYVDEITFSLSSKKKAIQEHLKENFKIPIATIQIPNPLIGVLPESQTSKIISKRLRIK